MGYKNDLIRSALSDKRRWRKFNPATRAALARCTDEQAREIMVRLEAVERTYLVLGIKPVEDHQ